MKFKEMNQVEPIFEIYSEEITLMMEKVFENSFINFVLEKQKTLEDLEIGSSKPNDFDKKNFLKQKNKNIQSLVVYFLKEN